MKLNAQQNEQITNFLKLVPTNDLYSLVATVTNGLIETKTPDEAIKNIILHSESPKSILHRKKITKDVLFKYIHNCGVDVQISLEKHNMVEKIIDLWNITSSQAAEGSKPQDDLLSRPSVENKTVSQCDYVPSVGLGVMESEVDELAQKFSEWFYTLLNQHQTETEGPQLSTEHFWQDCSLHLSMVSASDSVVQEVHKDAASVVRLLCDTKLQHKLYFNPNLSRDGVQGKVDSHGLVLVMTCGTLHQVDKCVGIFEQVFAIARDPFSLNNWKIKNMRFMLKSVEAVSSQPTLNEGEFTRSLMA